MSKLIQTKSFVVYLFGPSPDGKFYVGQTEELARRINTHKKAEGGCPRFHEAIKHWGWDAFDIRVIGETYTLEEADSLEILSIKRYNSLWPGGYNMTLGGRRTRFDPDARVTGFVESPVKWEEIVKEGDFRLHVEDLVLCPVCGEHPINSPCAGCGVTKEFGEYALNHLLEGRDLESFEIPGTGALAKKFRECKDADLYINLMKTIAGGRQKIADFIPTAAIQYARQLIPYIKASLKHSVLVERGDPSLHLGRFIPFPGSKRDALQVMSTHRFLRKRKNELLESKEARIEVCRDALAPFDSAYKSKPHIEEILIERGVARDEIEQAKLDACLVYRAKTMGRAERKSLLPEKNETSDPDYPGNVDIVISISSPTESCLDPSRNYLFGDDLNHFSTWNGKPSLLVLLGTVERGLVIFAFKTNENRRAFVENLLETPIKNRRLALHGSIKCPPPGTELVARR